MPNTIPSWQPAGIEPRAPDLRPEGRPRPTDRRAELALDARRAAADADAEAAGTEAREPGPARASLWGLLSGEERVFYLAHSGPVTYGPRALGAADVTESRMGSHLDVRG